MVIKQRHYEEIRRTTFSATSRYDGVRWLSAVKYYLTRMHFVKSFNRLVRYYLIKVFLIVSKTGLSGTT